MNIRMLVSLTALLVGLVVVVVTSEINPIIAWGILAGLVTISFFKLTLNVWRSIVSYGLGAICIGILVFNLILWINFRDERAKITHQYGVRDEVKIQLVFGKHIATVSFLIGGVLGLHASKPSAGAADPTAG